VKREYDESLPVKNTCLRSQIVFAQIAFIPAKLAKEYCKFAKPANWQPGRCNLKAQ
jgi:hypothetical protein